MTARLATHHRGSSAGEYVQRSATERDATPRHARDADGDATACHGLDGDGRRAPARRSPLAGAAGLQRKAKDNPKSFRTIHARHRRP